MFQILITGKRDHVAGKLLQIAKAMRSGIEQVNEAARPDDEVVFSASESMPATVHLAREAATASRAKQ
jgi:hypothetical protein